MKNIKLYIFLSVLLVILIILTTFVALETPKLAQKQVLAAEVLQTVTIYEPDEPASPLRKYYLENQFIEPEPTIEESLILYTFNIKAKPEYRNSLNIPASIYFRKDGNLIVLEDNINLDENGFLIYEANLTSGFYDIGINGISHLTKTNYNLELMPTQLIYNLDYTVVDTVELIAGDTIDDNIIISSDLAKILTVYREQSSEATPLPSDITGDGIINSIDMAILLQNYRIVGDN